MTTDTRKPENEVALIRARAVQAGIFQGIYRREGEEFLYNVGAAHIQSLASSAIEFLEPFPDDVYDPRDEKGDGPKEARLARERTDPERGPRKTQKQEA